MAIGTANLNLIGNSDRAQGNQTDRSITRRAPEYASDCTQSSKSLTSLNLDWKATKFIHGCTLKMRNKKMPHQYSNHCRWMLNLLVAIAICVFVDSESQAQSSNWQRYSPRQRAQIRSMPILQRPSRPLHFYGNAVRRNGGQRYDTNWPSSSVKHPNSWLATTPKPEQETTDPRLSTIKVSRLSNPPGATEDASKRPDSIELDEDRGKNAGGKPWFPTTAAVEYITSSRRALSTK